MSSVAANDILAFAAMGLAIIGVIFGGINRLVLRRGIGAQFIRYNTIIVGFPIVAALAFQGLATEAFIALVADALAYAFAPTIRDEK